MPGGYPGPERLPGEPRPHDSQADSSHQLQQPQLSVIRPCRSSQGSVVWTVGLFVIFPMKQEVLHHRRGLLSAWRRDLSGDPRQPPLLAFKVSQVCVRDQRSNRQRSSENRSQHFNDMGLLQKLQLLPRLPRPLVHNSTDMEGKYRSAFV